MKAIVGHIQRMVAVIDQQESTELHKLLFLLSHSLSLSFVCFVVVVVVIFFSFRVSLISETAAIHIDVK